MVFYPLATSYRNWYFGRAPEMRDYSKKIRMQSTVFFIRDKGSLVWNKQVQLQILIEYPLVYFNKPNKGLCP
jgi:hypothetical protein